MVGIVWATVALLPLPLAPEAITMITRTTPVSSALTENQRAKPPRRGGRRLDPVALAFAAAAVFPFPFDSVVAWALLADFGAVFRAALGVALRADLGELFRVGFAGGAVALELLARGFFGAGFLAAGFLAALERVERARPPPLGVFEAAIPLPIIQEPDG
jgi:hypothetical protein